MAPSTPQKGHARNLSTATSTGTATPPGRYILASETTPTREGTSTSMGRIASSSSSSSLDRNGEGDRDQQDEDDGIPSHFSLRHDTLQYQQQQQPQRQNQSNGGGKMDELPSSGSSGSGGSFNSDSMLEVMDNEEDDEDLGMEFEEDEGDDEEGAEAGDGQPLVSRGGRRGGGGAAGRRRRWDEEGNKKERSLIQLIPPLILAHPLPLLPLLSLLPYNFLPAGVVFFIPIICVLALLSAAAHLVIVYLAWYLKVPSFEEVFASVTGKYGRYGRWAGRTAIMLSTVGLLVGWLGTLFPLLEPVIHTNLTETGFFASRITWTILASLALIPSLIPSRMTRSLRKSPIFIALLLPVVAFLIIGRTVEIKKALDEAASPDEVDSETVQLATRAATELLRRKFGLKGSSAGAGLTTLTIFLSPHPLTLPIHSALSRHKRSSFPLPALATSLVILVLTLPLALVPYYLLPNLDADIAASPTASAAGAGVFAQLPADDGWVNLARVLMCAVALGSANMWILRGRDVILAAMGVERGERQKAGRWVGLGVWALVVGLACVGGVVGEKIELLGVIATIAVSWLLPSLFFIITFHVRSPLSIVFPSRHPPAASVDLPPPTPHSARTTSSHRHTDSLSDPSADALLVRKERQLQKRRLGRRLWQDLIVYVGILPVGCVTLAWSLGGLVGVW